MSPRRAILSSAIGGYVLAIGSVSVAGLLAAAAMRAVPLPDPGMLFLVAVVITAARGGLRPSIAAAFLAVAVYDFFFVAPYCTFAIGEPQDVFAIGAFFGAAVLTSQLTARARAEARDVERSRVADVLAEKVKTEAVIESIDDGLVVLDPTGIVMHVNEVACAILDVERAAALGHPFVELGTIHPHYLRLRAAVSGYLADPHRAFETVEIARFLRGRDHFFVLRPNLLRAADDTPIGLILTLQDVTYLRDQEARREQLMATLSHELRTPLTSLRMAGDLLARADLPPESRSLIDAAREDVARLGDVAQRLLELSRSRAMSIGLDREKISIRDLIQRGVRIFELQAREAGVELETEIPAVAPEITGDATKLGWALSNLIGNALRYTQRGGTIQISLGTMGDAVRLSVRDNGPGIPPEQRQRIFERFAQGEEPGAAGLGLAIVRDVVQAHGGRIYLESQLGRGSRFTIEIPAT
jgi:NtrC-family two-component system sensor histidine kinase KinB